MLQVSKVASSYSSVNEKSLKMDGHVLIKQGILTKYCPIHKRQKQRKFLLYDDMLMYGIIQNENTEKVVLKQRVMPLNGIQVEEMESDAQDLPNCWRIICTAKYFSLCGPTPVNGQEWLDVLKICIKNTSTDYNEKSFPELDIGKDELLHFSSKQGSLQQTIYNLKKSLDVNSKDIDGLTPLHHAVKGGYHIIVELLLNNGADVNSTSNSCFTPLHFAAYYGNIKIAEILLDNGAKIDAGIDVFMDTPLQLAVKHLKYEMAQLLICRGANIDAKFDEAHYSRLTGGTLLHWAVRRYKDDLIRFLVENGSNINATEDDGRTPLCILAKHCRSLDVMRYLIEKGADLNNKIGGTPLYWAMDRYGFHCHKEEEDVINLLIEGGTDVNMPCDIFGDDYDQRQTPLHKVEFLSNVIHLIAKGANIEATDVNGNTPLHLVQNLPKAKYLLDKGANISARNNRGYTPLHLAKNYYIAKCLIEEAGANINATDNKGYTPLHTARDVFIANLLIEKGAQLHAVTNDGKTVLHIVAKKNDSSKEDLDLIDYFILEKGIDVNVTDNHGNIPLHLCAQSYGRYWKVLKLLENGANLDVRNDRNQTAIDCCESYGCLVSIVSAVNKLASMVQNGEDISKKRNLNNYYELFLLNTVYDNSKKLTLLHYAAQRGLNKALNMILRNLMTWPLKKTHPAELFWKLKRKNALNYWPPVVEKNQVNALNNDNWTALHYAAQRNHEICVQILLQSGAAYNMKNNDGSAPIALTTNNKIKNILNLVFQLIEAVKIGNIELVKECISQEISIVNAVEADGSSSLHWATRKGDFKIVEILLKNGSNPNLKTIDGQTPLYIAVVTNNFAILSELLLHNMYQIVYNINRNLDSERLINLVNIRTSDGTTALHIASQNGSLNCVKLLLKSGAIYNLKNNAGFTPCELSTNNDVTKFFILIDELFAHIVNGEMENIKIVNKLENIELDDLIAIINSRDNIGNTLADIAETNKNSIIFEKIEEFSLAIKGKLSLQNPSCLKEGFVLEEPEDLQFINLFD